MFILLLGQFLSLLITTTAISNDRLADCGKQFPSTQNMFVYLLLAFHIFPLIRKAPTSTHLLLADHHKHHRLFKLQLNLPWPYYLTMAFLDVEANFLVVLAYKYTAVFSIALISTCSIAWVMLFSSIILKRHYKTFHYIGSSCAILGVLVTIFNDYLHTNSENENSTHTIVGDIICFFGTALYALNNVFFEWSVKKVDDTEYLSMLGFFGFLVSLVQVLIFEPSGLADVFDSNSCTATAHTLYLVGYVLALVIFYCAVAVFLKKSESALFNLHLLTVNLYVVIVEVFVGGSSSIGPLYFLSLALITGGVCIYHSTTSPIENNDDTQEQQ